MHIFQFSILNLLYSIVTDVQLSCWKIIYYSDYCLLDSQFYRVCVYVAAGKAVLTLNDILGYNKMNTSDDELFNGKRIQLSSADVIKYATRIPWEARGRMTLEEVYMEKFLLCHAFVAGITSG